MKRVQSMFPSQVSAVLRHALQIPTRRLHLGPQALIDVQGVAYVWW